MYRVHKPFVDASDWPEASSPPDGSLPLLANAVSTRASAVVAATTASMVATTRAPRSRATTFPISAPCVLSTVLLGREHGGRRSTRPPPADRHRTVVRCGGLVARRGANRRGRQPRGRPRRCRRPAG